MPVRLAALVLLAASSLPSRAQDEYGAKGLYPVYEAGPQWVVYDKVRRAGGAKELAPGGKFLVVGSAGAQVFVVGRSSPTYDGACRARRPARLRAALLKGPRSAVGTPVMAVRVPDDFRAGGGRARYEALGGAVPEDLYARLGPAIAAASVEEAKSGAFKFAPEDAGAAAFLAEPKPESVTLKIDFAAPVVVAGLTDAVALVSGAQISSAYRRCLRLASGGRLVGGCAEMPHALMAETSLLKFVSYDPGGNGKPYLLAYTTGAPLWGHERWGFSLRADGPRLFLRDATDPRCREGF